jgi:carboxylesterase type B
MESFLVEFLIDRPVVWAPLGGWRGVSISATVDKFYGIPYAKPPVDSLRFRLPQEPVKRDKITSVKV